MERPFLLIQNAAPASCVELKARGCPWGAALMESAAAAIAATATNWSVIRASFMSFLCVARKAAVKRPFCGKSNGIVRGVAGDSRRSPRWEPAQANRRLRHLSLLPMKGIPNKGH